MIRPAGICMCNQVIRKGEEPFRGDVESPGRRGNDRVAAGRSGRRRWRRQRKAAAGETERAGAAHHIQENKHAFLSAVVSSLLIPLD